MRTFLKSFTSSAPHLAELYMDLQSKAVLHGRDNPFPIPPHMFNDESLQSLRFVKFNHVHIRQPHTFIWPNLRRIELTESRSWASPTSFVAFFSGVPLLEEFVSRNNELSRGEGSWVNATHVSDLPPLRSVTMEHLKVLKLHGPYRDMFLALATLNIPCTALVSLTLSGIWLADNQEAKMRIVHEAVQAHFAQATEDGAYFDSVAFDGRTMSASRPVQGVLSRCLPTSFTLSIPLLQYTDHDPSNDRQLLETSFAHPIFYRATSLTIQSLDKCGTSGSPHRLDSFYFDELRRIFELYAHVHTLKVIGEDVCSYVANIVLPDGQRPPNLTVLRIYGAQFTSVAAPPEANLVLAAVLLPCLLRLGETFELLHLHGCALGEKDVRMLREGLGEGRLSLVDNHSGIGGQR
ncbi:unnamed protein product [Peniophora sp. CBMAI 1063]|nr:unnamed protein product [Peniophora sp. CBMAI 1063]